MEESRSHRAYYVWLLIVAVVLSGALLYRIRAESQITIAERDNLRDLLTHKDAASQRLKALADRFQSQINASPEMAEWKKYDEASAAAIKDLDAKCHKDNKVLGQDLSKPDDYFRCIMVPGKR